MGSARYPVIRPGPDLVRTYTVEEERRLFENLVALTNSVHRGEYAQEPLDEGLLCHFHHRLFAGVRDHAGHPRSDDFGSETLTFGPNRSVHRREVGAQLRRVFQDLCRSISSFDQHPDDPSYDESALKVAAWAHAEIIRIHPFEDGNGRTSRALMNSILVRLGLFPIAMDAVKQEYQNCLNHYYRTRDIELLADLCLRLYSTD